jgi:hypothetical protein
MAFKVGPPCMALFEQLANLDAAAMMWSYVETLLAQRGAS